MTLTQTYKKSIDRAVDDIIKESMARGEFDNLSGTGKPLKNTEHESHVDTFTVNLNKVLINNGFAPEWIMIEKEIR